MSYCTHLLNHKLYVQDTDACHHQLAVTLANTWRTSGLISQIKQPFCLSLPCASPPLVFRSLSLVATLFLVTCMCACVHVRSVSFRRSDFLPVTWHFPCGDRNKLPTFKFIKIVILPFSTVVFVVLFIFFFFFFSNALYLLVLNP